MNATKSDELHTALYEGRDTPSTGLVAVFLMIQLCKKITVYGFTGMVRASSNTHIPKRCTCLDTCSCGSGAKVDGKEYHYFRTPRNYMNRTHAFSAERALLRALARDGWIIFEEVCRYTCMLR